MIPTHYDTKTGRRPLEHKLVTFVIYYLRGVMWTRDRQAYLTEEAAKFEAAQFAVSTRVYREELTKVYENFVSDISKPD